MTSHSQSHLSTFICLMKLNPFSFMITKPIKKMHKNNHMINLTVVILHRLGYIISVYLTPITNALITLDFCLIDNFEKKKPVLRTYM